jgi:hypothetical protein
VKRVNSMQEDNHNGLIWENANGKWVDGAGNPANFVY